jgi:hypothetical protein
MNGTAKHLPQDLINLQRVAEAMTTIQQLFLPSLAEQKGLIALQHDLIRSVIVAYAANPENYRIPVSPPVQVPGGLL